MRREFLTGIVISFLTLLIGGTRTSAGVVPLPEEEEKAIFVLLDPHAGSNSKISAVRVLMSRKFQARSPEGERIVAALMRQAHYDMGPVRELCKTALTDMLGSNRAAQVVASYDPSKFVPWNADFVMDFRRAARGWKGSDELAEALASESSSARQGAMRQLVALAEADPHHFPAFEEYFKFSLIDDLDRFDRVEPSMRSSTLILVEQLISAEDAAVPLLRRALADKSPAVRKIVERFYNAGEKDPRYRAIAAAIASGLVSSDPRIVLAAAKLVPGAPSDSLKMQIARALAGSASGGNAERLALLKRYEIKPAMYAQAAGEALPHNLARSWRLSLLDSLRQAGLGNEIDDLPDLQKILVPMLVADDEALATSAAALLTTSKTRGEAEERLAASIKAGTTIAAGVMKTLQPDPQSFSEKLAAALRNEDVSVRQAAVRALLVTGIKGDAIRAALEPLVRNEDSEVRHGAAALLNTPHALAEAKLPDLLADIRSNSISARQLAARQLDELNIEPKEMTAALVRAVEGGDFAARQGLLAALNDGYASRRNPLEVLKETASDEKVKGGVRAFARAGLHEVEHPTLRKEARP